MPQNAFYEELTPPEFRARLAAAPIAYLPLGTLEWHGEQLPLGTDGIVPRGFFQILAERVGGIILPMLFLGPDLMEARDGGELYGMDILRKGRTAKERTQLDGSAYWVSEDIFRVIIEHTLKQLQRAGFRIVVAHGHGPSNNFFTNHIAEWKERFGLDCFGCWGSEEDKKGLALMGDHAGANETSCVMAVRPDLVRLEQISDDPQEWPIAIGAHNPATHASVSMGQRIFSIQLERMENILRGALAKL